MDLAVCVALKVTCRRTGSLVGALRLYDPVVCESNKRQRHIRNFCKSSNTKKCSMMNLILEKTECYPIVILEVLVHNSFVIDMKSLEMRVVNTGCVEF